MEREARNHRVLAAVVAWRDPASWCRREAPSSQGGTGRQSSEFLAGDRAEQTVSHARHLVMVEMRWAHFST